MNTDDLDAFFAKADDVLTDWDGGGDAMRGVAPEPGTEDDLAPAGESYYTQAHSRVADWCSMSSLEIFAMFEQRRALRGVLREPLIPVTVRPIEMPRPELTTLNGQRVTIDPGSITLTITPQRRPTVPVELEPLRDSFALIGRAIAASTDQILVTFKAVQEIFQTAGLLDTPPPAEARARALHLRQNRNTGPGQQRRLDGRRSR